MGHRKWIKARSWREFHADDMIAEHNTLYDAWLASERRAMDTLDENNRLDRELDEARKRIAELEAPIRVPFNDAQIERMAKAAREVLIGPCDADANRPMWYRAIRAALAAGGLEPCAVPEYAPEDVALAPIERVLRHRLADVEAKAERQRKNLNQLYTANANLRDQLAAADLDLSDKAFYVREFAAVSAERDALKAENKRISEWSADATTKLAALRERASIDPTADQVEALARVLQSAYSRHIGYWADWDTWTDYRQDGFRAEARAAIAHLAKRPEGLPTREQLLAAHMQYAQDYEAGKNDGSLCASDFALDYLRPWLRDPVGFELDVTAEEVQAAYYRHQSGSPEGQCWHQVIELIRSRIRPTFECAECAKVKAECRSLERQNSRLGAHLDTARAALEGE